MVYQSIGSEPERCSGLGLVPILATGCYYVLPSPVQALTAVQFVPQLIAYLMLAVWIALNTHVPRRLGLEPHHFGLGLRWGIPTGLALGMLNVSVILWIIPQLGGDIEFLRETPHARMPVPMMLPWFIILIAVLVELNFRGFLLGRLLALFQRRRASIAPMLAIGASSLVFSCDPFMVATFRHLHWIAVWDGMVWGMLWLRLRNLYVPIIAHAVEVMVMYSVLKLLFEKA